MSLKDDTNCPNLFDGSSADFSRGITGPLDKFIINLEDKIRVLPQHKNQHFKKHSRCTP